MEMRAVLITIFCAGLWLNGFAGMLEDENSAKVSGKITDKETKQPIEFATISLYKMPDTTLVTGTITDELGAFELKGLKQGTYMLEIGFIGYKNIQVGGILIDKKTNKLSLGEILIEQDVETLNEVVIAGEKRIFETKIDRKIFNVSEDPASQGGTGLEAMNNVPSVEVDVDGNISLRGDQNVNILVNGRPMNISPQHFLEQTPANQIEKIEVITNPSAKYNPEGMSGIINIVMKKNRSAGINGNVNVSLGTDATYFKYPKKSLSGALNYQTAKVNVFGNIGLDDRERWSSGINNRIFTLSDSTNNQFTNDFDVRNSKSWNTKLGVDYFLNDNNVLYTSFRYRLNDGGVEEQLLSNWKDNAGELNFYSERGSSEQYSGAGYNINSGWQHKFKKEGHTLDFDATYNYDKDNDEGHIKEEFFTSQNEVYAPTVRQFQKTNPKNTLLFSRLDYVLPISDSMKLEAGTQFQASQQRNSFHFANFDDSIGNFITDTLLSNTFHLNRNIWSTYATFSQQIGKLGYKAGIRMENTDRTSELKNTSDSYNLKYLSFFPTLHLSYQLGKYELMASYSRRLNRPRLGMLNPFSDFSNPYTIRSGNPFLRPEFVDVYEMGGLRYWEKFNVNATVYHRHQKNMMRRFLSLRDDGVSEVTFVNQASNRIYGGEIILSYSPSRVWRNSATWNYFYSKLSNDRNMEGFNHTAKGWSLQYTSSYRFKNGASVQLNGRYRSKRNVLQGEIFPMYGIDLSAQFPILQKKGRISVRYSDVFGTRKFRFKTSDIGYHFDVERNWETQSVYVTFNYSFGKKLNNKKKRINQSGSSDRYAMPGF